MLSHGYSPSFKNFFIDDTGSSRFNFNDAIFRFLNDDHDVLVFPNHNRPSGPPMQMGFSANGNSSFILAGEDVEKFQPLRMGFES